MARTGVGRNRRGSPRTPTGNELYSGVPAPVVSAAAAGTLKVWATATATVIAPPVPIPLAPTTAKRPANQPARARLNSRFITTTAVVTAQAVGYVKVRAAANGDSIPQAMRPLKADVPNTPKAASLRSRIASVQAPAGIVTAQAVGLVRVRATAAASVIEVAAAQGRVRVRATAAGDSIPQAMAPARGRVANTPKAARLRSRVVTAFSTITAQGVGTVRVRSTAVASVIEVAVASGRVRVRSAAIGDPIPQAMGPARGRVANTPQAARLRARVQDVRPEAGIVTAQAVGLVRIRATASAAVIEIAAAQGRVRVRGTAAGISIPQAMGPVRGRIANAPLRSRLGSRRAQVETPAGLINAQATGTVRIRSTAVGTVTPQAAAQGRIRVRGTADGSSIPKAMRPVTGRVANTPRAGRLRSRIQDTRPIVTAQAIGRIRVRSSVSAFKVIATPTRGRIRIRSTAVGDTFGLGFVFGSAKGRIRLRSRASSLTFDSSPLWPQTNDPDSWSGDPGIRWPQTNDPDQWQSYSDLYWDEYFDVYGEGGGPGTGGRWPQTNTTGWS